MLRREFRFAVCENCINRIFDPFQCDNCIAGNNCETEDDSEELTYAEFIDLFKETT